MVGAFAALTAAKAGTTVLRGIRIAGTAVTVASLFRRRKKK